MALIAITTVITASISAEAYRLAPDEKIEYEEILRGALEDLPDGKQIPLTLDDLSSIDKWLGEVKNGSKDPLNIRGVCIEAPQLYVVSYTQKRIKESFMLAVEDKLYPLLLVPEGAYLNKVFLYMNNDMFKEDLYPGAIIFRRCQAPF